MKSGDIVLTLLPQADGHAKLRPVLVLGFLIELLKRLTGHLVNQQER